MNARFDIAKHVYNWLFFIPTYEIELLLLSTSSTPYIYCEAKQTLTNMEISRFLEK